jgi:hypothetical protein
MKNISYPFGSHDGSFYGLHRNHDKISQNTGYSSFDGSLCMDYF